MFRLALIVFLFVGPTLAGICVIAALASGLDTQTPILVAAGIGAAAAIPVAWKIAGLIREGRKAG